MNINEFRKAYPQYDDLSDEQVATKLHSSFYSDIDKKAFNDKFFAGSGSAAGDLGTSLKSGIASLAQLPSNLYGMATGDYNALGGQALREYQQELQGKYSPLYRQQQREMESAIKAKEGEAGQFAEAIKQYVTNPRVLMGETVKQVPQVAADIGLGFGAGAVGRRVAAASARKGAEEFVARTAAERAAVAAESLPVSEAVKKKFVEGAVDRAAPEIAKAGERAAYNTATGLMAGMQGGDVAQQTYQSVYDEALKRGMPEEQAHKIATEQARAAGLVGGAASFASMRLLPGIEKSLFGRPARTLAEKQQAVTFLERLKAGQGAVPGALKSFAGEAGQEMFEEGAGQLAQNLALTRVNPEQNLGAGMGQTLAQAGLLGGILGGPVGAIQGIREQGGITPLQAQPETKPEFTEEELKNLPAGAAPTPSNVADQLAALQAQADARRIEQEKQAEVALGLEEVPVEEVPKIEAPAVEAPVAAPAPAVSFVEGLKGTGLSQSSATFKQLEKIDPTTTEGQEKIAAKIRQLPNIPFKNQEVVNNLQTYLASLIATPAAETQATITPEAVTTPTAPEVQDATQTETGTPTLGETPAPIQTAEAGAAGAGVPSEVGTESAAGGPESGVAVYDRAGEPSAEADRVSGGEPLGLTQRDAEAAVEATGGDGAALTEAQSGLTDPYKAFRGVTREEAEATGLKPKSAYLTELTGMDFSEARSESQVKTLFDRLNKNSTISAETKQKIRDLIAAKREGMRTAQEEAQLTRPRYESRANVPLTPTEPEVVGPPVQQVGAPQNIVTAQGETTRGYFPQAQSGVRGVKGTPTLAPSTEEDINALAEAQAGREQAIDLNSQLDAVASELADLDADNTIGYDEELKQIANTIQNQGSAFAKRNNVPSLTKALEETKALRDTLKASLKENQKLAKSKDRAKVQEAFTKLDNAVRAAQDKYNVPTVAARAGQTSTTAGVPLEQAKQIVAEIISNWNRDVRVQVVNRNNLPEGFQQALLDQNLLGAKGFITEDGAIFIIANNNTSAADIKSTLFHEGLGHLGLRLQFQQRLGETMREIYNTNADVKRDADQWLKEHADEVPATYTPAQRVARAVEEVLAERAESGDIKPSIMAKLVSAIRNFARRMGMNVGFNNADVARIMEMARNAIVKVEGKAVISAPADSLAARKKGKTKKAGEPQLNDSVDGMPVEGTGLDKAQVDEQIKKSKKQQKEDARMAKVIKPELNTYTKWVTKLQNDRRPLLEWENALKKAGKFVSDMAGKFNNIFEQITLSSGVAEDHYKARVAPLNRKLDDLTVRLSKSLGKDLESAREIAGNYLAMIHEPERRMIKYLTSARLSGIGEEQRRNLIAPLISKKATELTPAQIAPIRQQLIDLVMNDPENTSSPMSDEFNVTAVKTTQGKPYEIDATAQQKLLAHYERMFAANPDAQAAFAEMRETVKQLNDVTTEMRKEANHIGPQAANIMNLYGFENYVPFRGRPNVSKEETLYDFVERKFGGELQDQDYSFGGRSTPPENPLMRVMVEGAKASIQLARQNVTQSIYNASDKGDGTLNAKVLPISQFSERFTLFKTMKKGKHEAETAQKPLPSGENLIYHYMPNGEIAVIKVLDPIMNEAIRRTYRGSSSPLWDYANQFTSFMGQSHTRYNPAFGIMNYVRDALTNIFAMYAEHGLRAGNQLAANIAQDIATGRIAKSAQVAFLYEKGDLKKIEQMSANDPYIKDMFEYLQNGGKVSYIGGLSTQSQMDQLNKLVSKNPLVQAKRKIDFVLDRWVDTFEFSSRVAAFRAAKQAGMDPVSATAYAKNLANFEQIGMYGKELGSLFMFFRQSATGAVRAIDALTKGKYGKQTAALGIALGFTMYMMSMMLSGDDEEGRNRTAVDDMQRWQRYARFHIFGLEDPVQIPWGFGLGAFAATGAQLAGMLFNPNANVGEFGKNLASIFSGSFSPIAFSQAASPIDNPALFVADTIAPTPFKPLLEFATNVDGLGREIYGNRYSRYSDAYVSSDTAPAYLRDFATTLFNASNGSLDISPGTLNFMISSYLDGFGRMTGSLDGLMRSAFSDREIRPIKDTLLFASFQGKGADPDAKAFASLNEEIDTSMRKIRSIEKDPNRFALWIEDADHQAEYARVKAFNSMVNQGLDDIRQMRNQIRLDESLTAQQRQDALKELRGPMNTYKRAIMEAMREI